MAQQDSTSDDEFQDSGNQSLLKKRPSRKSDVGLTWRKKINIKQSKSQ